MSASALLVRNLRKTFGTVTAVDHIDLDIPAGECFGLLGPNGAGKTTTIEICEGLTEPDSGDVTVLGRTWRTDARELRERLGIQLQETQLSEKLTVEETLQLFRSFYRQGRPVDDTIALVQLEEKRKARVGTLSGGQKQRLALACALVGDPELLFLDEPTTGLDPQSRRQLWELVESLKSQGRTILITTHYMEEAERLCDRVAIVDRGKVIALGTPRELIASLGAAQIVFFSVATTGEGRGPASDNTATGGHAGPGAVAHAIHTDAALDDTTLAAISGAAGATRAPRATDGGWELQVDAPHHAIPALLAELPRHGARLTELRTHSPTLEDVFVTLTGRALRDG